VPTWPKRFRPRIHEIAHALVNNANVVNAVLPNAASRKPSSQIGATYSPWAFVFVALNANSPIVTRRCSSLDLCGRVTDGGTRVREVFDSVSNHF